MCTIIVSTLGGWTPEMPLERVCMELRRARGMLIPLVVVSAVLCLLGVVRVVVLGRERRGNAEERVRVLQEEDVREK